MPTPFASFVKEAFETIKRSIKKALALLAPPGGGKTTETSNLIAKRLRNKQYSVYLANQKSDLYQFAETLFKLLTKTEIKKVQIICREADSEIYDSTLVVLTHKTYYKRKGFSNLHYAIMLWLEKSSPKGQNKKVWVIIDEVQAYVRDQSITLPRGGRYFVRRFKDHIIPRKEIISHCLVTAGRGNCAFCKLCKENYLASDSNGIVEVRTYLAGKTGLDYPPLELPPTETLTKVQYNTLIIEELAQKPTTIRRYTAQLRDEQEPPGLEEIFEDLLTWAHRPRKYSFTPVTKETKEPIDWERIKQEFDLAENISESEKELAIAKRDIKAKYHFPQAVCNIETYEFQDKSSLSYIYQHAEKVIFLGATIRQDEQEFLQACCPDVEFMQITESNHKIDELAVVIFRKKLSLVNQTGGQHKVEIQEVLDSLQNNQKALVFTPKKKDAEELYREFPRGYPVAKLNGEDITIDQKTEALYKIGITWELGPLGIGINRPQDYLAIIDGESYLPIIAYGHDSKITPEIVEAGYRQRAEDTLIQCGGRILRGTGRKVVILHNVEKLSPDLEVIRQAWQGMVNTPIQFITVEESQDYVSKVVTEYLASGKFPQETEEEYIKEKLTKKAQREMSHEEREIIFTMTTQQKKDYYHKKQEEKHRKTLARLIEQGKELKTQGKNWGEIYDALNLNRHNDLVATIKRELIF